MSFTTNFTCPLCGGTYDHEVDSWMYLIGARVCEDCGTVYKTLERRGDTASVGLVNDAQTKLKNATPLRDQYTIYAEDNW